MEIKLRISSFVLLLASALWAWWGSLQVLAERWSRDPQYSHGYLIPLLACGMLWLRRRRLDSLEFKESWWAIVLLAIAISMRLVGAYFYFEWFDALSLLPCLSGICLGIFGVRAFRWSLPVVLFLIFMIPLPFRVEMAVQYPLRQMGTIGSVYAMQTLGLPAVSHGNIISIGETQIGVAEACSGLRMMMVFLALTCAAGLLSQRSLWERVIIVLSGIPIALVSNIVRISATGVLYATNRSELAQIVFHDVAGWLMMPLAFAMLCGELWLLSRLIVIEEDKPVRIGLG